MEIKKDAEPIASSDIYYDLFDGGYLNPEKFLENEQDVFDVRSAIGVIESYISELQDIIDDLTAEPTPTPIE